MYYTWRSGQEDWQQFATVFDQSGNLVSFDEPMRFTYVHSQANDINNKSTYDGKTFTLEYNGFDLHVPWEYNSETDDWEPLINLVDGVQLANSSGTYVVKGIEESLFMREVEDQSVASGLVVDTSIQPPSFTYNGQLPQSIGMPPQNVQLMIVNGEPIESDI